jgi:hypothetical protein
MKSHGLRDIILIKKLCSEYLFIALWGFNNGDDLIIHSSYLTIELFFRLM